MRLRFEKYGCALNRGQARELEELAEERGHSTDASEGDADAVLVATCTVIQSTENRMLARLRVLHERGRRVVVAGCMAVSGADRVRKACPEAVLLPPGEYGRFPELLAALGDIGPDPRAPRAFSASVEEIPVADGYVFPWE